ncbi:hypothetical protein [Pseudomonas sp. CGJS7]|uniref:hypothetical protein n=1 Tax=Pseudomonas sp. CGJS7 TaxID=3109348 RepID=UPI00300AA77E
MTMHNAPQTSGLPFPALLRKELFDPRGLPEWYCPVQGGRSLPEWVLVIGSFALFGALFLAIALVPHQRTQRIRAVSERPAQACTASQVECRIVLRIAPDSVPPATAPVGSEIVVATSAPNVAEVTAKVAQWPAAAQAEPALVHVAWPARARLPSGEVTISFVETRTLFGWLLLRTDAARRGRPQP